MYMLYVTIIIHVVGEDVRGIRMFFIVVLLLQTVRLGRVGLRVTYHNH